MSGSDTTVQFMKSVNEVVRNQALGTATSLVDYHSAGHCLIVGSVEPALEIVPKLDALTVTILQTDNALTQPEKRLTDTGIHVYTSPVPRVQGYLGAFDVQIPGVDCSYNLGVMRHTQTGYFDLILDLSSEPLVAATLPPFGYFYARDNVALQEAIEQLPDMVGEFEKPRYFDYSADSCAHSRSQLGGCSACKDSCVTGAITSLGEGVEVNPYLCQGCGTCATVCPSGAMTYAYPRPADAIARTREMLMSSGVKPTTLLIYASKNDADADADTEFEKNLPTSVLAVAVEEASAYGIDYWAAMLAAGFHRVVVFIDATQDHTNFKALQFQADLLGVILEGLGLCRTSVSVVNAPLVSATVENATVENANAVSLASVLAEPLEVNEQRRQLPHFATHNDKRQTFRSAIDQLIEMGGNTPQSVLLPAGSPFGKIDVDRQGCTLCLACVSVCPAGALLDGQGTPRLRFIESNCVQCGLCEQACPENVLTRRPAYTYDSLTARTTVTLNEEEPFNCVRCNKPFATRKMIDKMSVKLATHWMFGDDKAKRRLKMCDDCRVKDMFEDDAKGINMHKDA